MVDSRVTSVELTKDGGTAFTIQVVGFAEGKSVEVSGYITQTTGAYASFRGTRKVPKANSEGAAELEMTVPPKELELRKKEPVTVVTWVSEVWPSMLIEDTPTGPSKAVWKINQDGWGPDAVTVGGEPSGTDPSS